MRKSDKKLENSIVAALTAVCEDYLQEYEGFQWLTHIVNFNAFPQSLSIICVFDSQENLKKITGSNAANNIKSAIESRLLANNVKVKDIQRRILFDTEEVCESQHDGNWSRRFEGLKNARHA